MLPKKRPNLKDKHAENEVVSGATGEKVNKLVPVRPVEKKKKKGIVSRAISTITGKKNKK